MSAAAHLLMCRKATFHNNQPTKVPVSVIQTDTNEHNIGTETLWGIAGQ